MQTKDHWEQVYSTKPTTEASWFQEHAYRSVQLIQETGTPASAAIIDVGGGASTLTDDLLAHGYTNLTVLDLSAAALAAAKDRLGSKSRQVHWLEADILEAKLPMQGYDLWHDRAVFHFLTQAPERERYVQQVLHALKPRGLLIIATFAEDGPTQCSGLPVMRYSASQLHAQFATGFELLSHEREIHLTPSGNEQAFVYCTLRRLAEQDA